MKRNLFWLAAVGVVAFMIFSGNKGGPQIGAPAPILEAQTYAGDDPFVLSDHRGRVVLLDFWATWCPPCQHALPAIERLHQEYADDDDVVIMTVNTESGPADKVRAHLKGFIDRRKFTFPVALTDASQRVLEAYAISTIPTSVLVNKQGEVVSVHVGLPENTVDGIYRALKAEIEAAR